MLIWAAFRPAAVGAEEAVPANEESPTTQTQQTSELLGSLYEEDQWPQISLDFLDQGSGSPAQGREASQPKPQVSFVVTPPPEELARNLADSPTTPTTTPTPAIDLAKLTPADLRPKTDGAPTSDSAWANLGLIDLTSLIKHAAPKTTPSLASFTPTVDLQDLPQDPTTEDPAPEQAPEADSLKARVNSAGPVELMEKLQLDARRARMIVQFRALYGEFSTPDDLGQVQGIHDELVVRWEEENLLSFE